MTYWNNKGKYETEAAELQKLVPGYGNCDTYKGEVWRAATKIYHDYFNNGFGNNWMKPAAFLINNIELPEEVKLILFEHANGNFSDEKYDEEMELMIDTVIVALRSFNDTPNTVDMWEYKVPYELERQFWEEQSYEEEEDWCYEEDTGYVM